MLFNQIDSYCNSNPISRTKITARQYQHRSAHFQRQIKDDERFRILCSRVHEFTAPYSRISDKGYHDQTHFLK